MPSATPVGLVVLIMFLAFGEGGEDGQGGEEGGELETEYHFINKVKACLLWEIFYFRSLSQKKFIITILFVFFYVEGTYVVSCMFTNNALRSIRTGRCHDS
jgi:hypothetical protein